MKLLVGLGNPGTKYEKTRHNIGFMMLDALANAHHFSTQRTKFQGLLAEGRLGSVKTLLLKPMTYMNLSGQSVGEAMRFFRLTPEDIIVFHDELDLAPGKVKIKTGGGHAGHNGLRSLQEHIGADFQRVRLGIGHPGDKRQVSGYVLHDFAKADWDWLDPLTQAVVSAAPRLVTGDQAGFLNDIAQSRNRVAKTEKPTSVVVAKPKRPAKPKGAMPSTTSIDKEPEAVSPLQKLLERFSK